MAVGGQRRRGGRTADLSMGDCMARVWPTWGRGRVADSSCEPRRWFPEQWKKGRGMELSQSGEKDSHGDAIF